MGRRAREIGADLAERERSNEAKDEAPRKVLLLVCPVCKGVNVQFLDWVDANTNAIIGGNDGAGDAATWCEDCEGHTGVEFVEVTRTEYDERTKDRPK